MIIQANLMVTKMRLAKIARRQAAEMTNKVLAFKCAFDKVIQRGLPPFLDGNSDLIPLDTYKERLTTARENCANINALSLGIKGVAVYKVFYNDYGVFFDLKHIFDELGMPSYDHHA